MPEEILIIVLFSIASGTALSLARIILGYRERRSGKSVGEGSSLTTSELERMMRRAVEEATLPLSDKIDELESSLASATTPKRLTEARKDLLLDVESDESQASTAAVPMSKDRS